ncbi:conserved membrane protein of unknown function [Bartonella clarridgeiae 73]|uniref:Uncharacterized protein n=1 Tax=Bartonella clarridgeiae (strain CCUG 45776 / CIP 104772 / 73) TaxID=696125 RepID=E6YIX0_BARC7|nr:TIGR04086 family membrane protein [Bartonella clarridgeiae]WCR54609.1 MAG: hypothetical protein PG977_000002 [Bartonella clarridgeiae]WCR54626.1 MAG: hypothetical protein PG977_000019 [Bartonella clarridgeiae]CBI76808.1 conserved membrane protein of unknown function [Bartonella clarridgeiae 73]CBI76826.1 conserved membrane protein of unknown function [Bartonella clarridgeiae 73]
METRIPTKHPLERHFTGAFSLETETCHYSRPCLSWSSIFAGLLTLLATSVCFSFLLAALGFGQMSFSSPFSLEQSFFSVGVSSILVLCLSFSFGGYIAGRFASHSGALHGFLTWALFMLLVAIQSTVLLSGAVHLGAKTVSGIASATGQAISGLGSEGGKLISLTEGKNFENFFNDKNNALFDFNKLSNDLQALLNKSDIPALNPDNLYNAYRASLKDIRSTITSVKHDPSNYRLLVKQLGERLSDRVKKLNTQIDRRDVIDGLTNNGMSQAEAEKTADRAIDIYQTANKKTKEAIQSLNKQVDTLSHNVDKVVKNSRQVADQAIGTASKIGLWSFFGSLLGAFITSISGYYGHKRRCHSYKF